MSFYSLMTTNEVKIFTGNVFARQFTVTMFYTTVKLTNGIKLLSSELLMSFDSVCDFHYLCLNMLILCSEVNQLKQAVKNTTSAFEKRYLSRSETPLGVSEATTYI